MTFSASPSQVSSPSVTRTTIFLPSAPLRSLATLATNFEGATPTEATRSSSSWIADLIPRATAFAGPNRRSLAVTSRKASSSESGSMSGV